jgi:hypothetical protein
MRLEKILGKEYELVKIGKRVWGYYRKSKKSWMV